MGTARGSTQGSWRPFAFSSISSPLVLTVRCEVEIVAVGLKATRNVISDVTVVRNIGMPMVNLTMAIAHTRPK